MARLLLLVGLRFRLALRYYAGNKSRLIGAIVALAFAVPLSLLMTLAVTHAFLGLPEPERGRLYDVILLAGSVLLVVPPLMGFRSNEFLDVSKLFLFPLRPSVVFSATVIGSWFNGINVFFVPVLLAPAIAGAGNAAEAGLRVALVLLYLFVLFSITQCLTLAMLNVLRSRRFRDLVAVLTPLVGLGMFLGIRFLFLTEDRRMDLMGLLQGFPFDGLRPFLPPLWAGAAVMGEGIGRSLWILALVLLGLPLVRLGLVLTRKAFYGEVALVTDPKAVRQRPGFLRRLVLSLVRPETGAMYEKELITLRREPWFKTLFLQQISFVIILVVLHVVAPVGAARAMEPRFILLMAALFLLYIAISFVSNVFALEGPGILHLLILPADRKRILVGKNLAHMQVLFLLNTFLLGVLATVLWLLAPEGGFLLREVLLLVAVNAAALPVVVGTGAVCSVYFPTGMAPRGKRALSQETTGNEGCVVAFYRALVAGVMLVPVGILGALVFLVPLAVPRPWIHLLTVPTAVLVGSVLYLGLLQAAAVGFQRREGRLQDELLRGAK